VQMLILQATIWLTKLAQICVSKLDRFTNKQIIFLNYKNNYFTP